MELVHVIHFIIKHGGGLKRGAVVVNFTIDNVELGNRLSMTPFFPPYAAHTMKEEVFIPSLCMCVYLSHLSSNINIWFGSNCSISSNSGTESGVLSTFFALLNQFL